MPRYAPPIEYLDDGDMIHARRQDGQRIIIHMDDDFDNQEKIGNAVFEYNKKKYIDYIICRDSDYDIIDVCSKLRIPVLLFQEDFNILHPMERRVKTFRQMVANGLPTQALFFRTNPEFDYVTHNMFTEVFTKMSVETIVEYADYLYGA